MVKITPKNIPKVWEDEQKQLREYVHGSLAAIEVEFSNHKAVMDAREFEDEFYSHRVNTNLLISFDGRVLFTWGLPDGEVQVRFLGDGIWSYSVNTSNLQMNFEGKGIEYSMIDRTYDDGESPYMFFVNETVGKVIYKDDEFQNEYEPVYRLTTSDPIPNHSVQILWSTNKWDGPLEGYCWFNKELHYFSMIEETDIDRKRMYALHKLNIWEKVKARIDHYSWIKITSIKLLWKLYIIKYNLKQKYEKWRYGDDSYKVYRKKHDLWLSKHEKVGFFTY